MEEGSVIIYILRKGLHYFVNNFVDTLSHECYSNQVANLLLSKKVVKKLLNKKEKAVDVSRAA